METINFKEPSELTASEFTPFGSFLSIADGELRIRSHFNQSAFDILHVKNWFLWRLPKRHASVEDRKLSFDLAFGKNGFFFINFKDPIFMLFVCA